MNIKVLINFNKLINNSMNYLDIIKLYYKNWT